MGEEHVLLLEKRRTCLLLEKTRTCLVVGEDYMAMGDVFLLEKNLARKGVFFLERSMYSLDII